MNELIHKRGWDSKTFDTGRTQTGADKRELPIYGTKIQNGMHDIEPDGSFVDINKKYTPYKVGVSSDRIVRNRCGEVRISDTESVSKDLAKIKTKRNRGISLKLKEYVTDGPFFWNNNSAYYTTNGGIKLWYHSNYKGLNIEIEIANPQTASNVYRFTLKEYGCNYTYEEINGSIKCVSSTGEDDIWIKATYAVDANGDYGNVSMRLGAVDSDGYQVIEKVITPVWLGNAVGPVLSDPNVTIDDVSGTFEDANISSVPTQEDYNWGSQLFNQHYNGTLNFSNNVAYYVDLSAIPSGVTVTSAKYIFNCVLTSGAAFTVTVNPILRAWGEGIQAGSAAATGEITGNSARHNEELWTALICTGSGTDYNATAAASFTSPAGTGVFDVDLTTVSVQDKIDGSNNGDIFRVPLTNTGAYYREDSSESGGIKPALYIEYTEGELVQKLAGIFGIGRIGVR